MKKSLLFILLLCLSLIINAQTRITFEGYTSGQVPPTTDIVVNGSSPTSTLTVVDLPGATTGNTSSKALKITVNNYDNYVYFKNFTWPANVKSNYGAIRFKYCMDNAAVTYPDFRIFSATNTTTLNTAIATPAYGTYIHSTPPANVWRVVEYNLANITTINTGYLALGFRISGGKIYYIDDVELVAFPAPTTIPFVVNDFDSSYFNIDDNMRMNPLDNAGKGTAIVKADPANASNKVVQITQTTTTAAYFRMNVVLPADKNFSDYGKISFDLRTVGAVTGKMNISSIYGTSNTKATHYSESSNTIQGTADTWVNKIYTLASIPASTNSFILDLGIAASTAGASYYIDNIKLLKNLSVAPTASAASSITSNSFAANWAVLDGAQSYQLDVATDEAFTNILSGYNNLNVENVLTYNISGLDANTTYYYRVRGYNPGYTSSSSSIKNLTTTAATAATDYFRSKTSGNWGDISTWESSSDHSTWSSATLCPTSSASSISILNGHLVTVAANATASALTINAGGKLTLNEGYTLDATTFTIESDAANGTGTFVNKGTLTATASSVKQYLTGATGSGRQWWYVSSPVTGATSSVFEVGTTNKFGYYDESTTAYQQITGNDVTLLPGNGYVAKLGGIDAVYTFTGPLNNGSVQVPVTRTGTTKAKRGFNLIGNPYPSYLDWGLVDTTNFLTTIWYRSYSSSSSEMVFDTYNGKTGIGINLSNTSNKLSNLIPPMQAFWVKVRNEKTDVAGLTVDFSNAMRSHKDFSTTGLLRSAQASVQQVLRLEVSNGINSDQTVLVFNDKASNDFDDYDSPKISNDNVNIPEIYTLVGDEHLAIKGLSNLEKNSNQSLGFSTGTSDTFTIKAREISNFDTDIKVLLKDNLTGTEQDLTDGESYSFTSDTTTTTSRFSISFKTAGTPTKIDDIDYHILAYGNTNNQITVVCSDQSSKQSSLTVYNTIGQKLINQKINDKTTITNKAFVPGIYIVVVNYGEKSVIRKVVIN